MPEANQQPEALSSKRPMLLVDWVTEEIETRIFAGDLVPGEKINELSLAAQLGVSRSPIRESLRALEQARLVEVIPHRGAFVRWLSEDDAADLYEVRSLLATRAAELSVPNLDADDIRQMRELVAEIDQISAEGSIRRFTHFNYNFHAIILKACGNKRLAEMYLGVVKEFRLNRRQQLIGVDNDHQLALEHQRQSNAEHDAIVTALEKGDLDKAIEALSYHDLQGRVRSEQAARQGKAVAN